MGKSTDIYTFASELVADIKAKIDMTFVDKVCYVIPSKFSAVAMDGVIFVVDGPDFRYRHILTKSDYKALRDLDIYKERLIKELNDFLAAKCSNGGSNDAT